MYFFGCLDCSKFMNILDLLKINKFRTVRKYEDYEKEFHLRGAGYMAPSKKYLLHDREIHSVLPLRHFESLYHVLYFFAISECSKFVNILVCKKFNKI